MNFMRPQSRIKVWVGWEQAPDRDTTVFLEADGAPGANTLSSVPLLIKQGSRPEPANHPIEIKTGSPSILVVELHVVGNLSLVVLDDIEFEAVVPPVADLAVTHVTPRGVLGGPLTITATITNLGPSHAPAATLTAWVDSLPRVIRELGGLDSGASADVEMTLSQNTTPGEHAIQVRVDPGGGATDPAPLNNVFAARFAAAPPPSAPPAPPFDLAITLAQGHIKGMPATIMVTVANAGGVAAPRSTVVVRSGDKEMGRTEMVALQPGQATEVTIKVTVALTAGIHPYEATVTAQDQLPERSTANNRAGGDIEIAPASAALKMESREARADDHGQITLSVTVHNRGHSASELSEITATVGSLGWKATAVPALKAEGSHGPEVVYSGSAPPGVYSFKVVLADGKNPKQSRAYDEWGGSVVVPPRPPPRLPPVLLWILAAFGLGAGAWVVRRQLRKWHGQVRKIELRVIPAPCDAGVEHHAGLVGELEVRLRGRPGDESQSVVVAEHDGRIVEGELRIRIDHVQPSSSTTLEMNQPTPGDEP